MRLSPISKVKNHFKILEIFDEFSACSGLIVNKDKTVHMLLISPPIKKQIIQSKLKKNNLYTL